MFTSAGSVPAAQAADLSPVCTLEQQRRKWKVKEEECERCRKTRQEVNKPAERNIDDQGLKWDLAGGGT